MLFRSPRFILVRITATNRGPDRAPLHLLPTLWFRNTWAWGRDDRRAWLERDGQLVMAEHALLGTRWLASEGLDVDKWLFCDNETNLARLYGGTNDTPYPKDGINDHVLHGAATVNPANSGTKVAAWHTLRVEFAGNHFKLIFDGKHLFDVEDTTFTEPGKVGVWTKADSVTLFDDFTYGSK